VRIESLVQEVKIYTLFVAYDAPKTALEDRVLRALLLKIPLELLEKGDILPLTLSSIPFIDIESFLKRGGLWERSNEISGRGFLLVMLTDLHSSD